MSKVFGPRHGSLQFWPRKKARRMVANVGSWVKNKNVTLQGFAGYKAGMTHIVIKDTRPNSMTKNEELVLPVTVIECPAIKVYSIRLYKKTPYGIKVVNEVLNAKQEKNLARKVDVSKKYKFEERLKDVESKINEYSEVRVLVHTQPKKSAIGKKTPEIFELNIGGNDIKAKFDYAKGLLDKEIKVSDILKAGNKVDAHSVTKGKGFQGVVKRFGVQLRSHKSEKKRRGAVIGTERPAKVRWGATMAGKMGSHLRTEYNKDILLVDDKPDKVNPKGGFLNYGLIKGDYILIKGSVAGARKRLITFTDCQRPGKVFGTNFSIQYVSQESKQ